MSKFGLTLSKLYDNSYNEDCTTTIFNEFATAAFRFGHTLVRPHFTLMSNSRKEKKKILMRNHFHNPDILMKSAHFIDELVSSL